MVAFAAAALGCSKDASKKEQKEPARPLFEAIVGKWDALCRSESASKTRCEGKEPYGLYKIFRPDGTLETGSRKNSVRNRGTWKLDGDALTLVIGTGRFRLTERWRARIVENQLILWSAERGFGSISARHGKPFVPATTEQSTGKRMEREHGGVRYSLELPTGMRLAEKLTRRQRWEPVSGEGWTVELTVSPRPKSKVGDKWVTPPCGPHASGWGSSSSKVGGVQRYTSTGKSLCVERTTKSLDCSVGHTRGYLREAELDPARALCKTLRVE